MLAYKMSDFFKLHATNWDVLDVENMSGGGSFMEKTSASIASAGAVIAIVSPGYEKSANCKLELLAAKKWGKSTIFVLPDASYNGGTSWLNFALRDEVSYDLSDPEMLSSKLSEIIKVGFTTLVRGEDHPGPHHHQGAAATNGENAVPMMRLPIVTMNTVEDVQQWLISIGFSAETSSVAETFASEEIDGQCVRALAGMSVPELKSFLGLTKKSEVLRLKASLEDLYY